MTTAIISTLLAGLGLGFAPTPSTVPDAAPPVAALNQSASLLVSTRSASITDLGGGKYETTLQAAGTLTIDSQSTSTALSLTCLVDHNLESLDCSGGIGVNGTVAPIALVVESIKSKTTYAIREEFLIINGFAVAWDLWFTEELIHVVPPVDDEGEPDTTSGSILSGNGPGAIVVEGAWGLMRYRSDWMIIIDGIIMNPEYW